MAASRSFSIALAFAAVYLLWGSTYLAIRVGVEDLADAVPAELAHRRVAIRTDVLLDSPAYPVERLPGATVLDGGTPAVVGDLDKPFARFVDIADEEHL